MRNVEKVTISLPTSLLSFVTGYQALHHLNRSEVIQKALQVLRDQELSQAYQDAAGEIKADPLFDLQSTQGLQPSTETDW